MNKAILVGRLTRDPELKTTPNGVNVCSFTLAIDRRFAKDQTDFINCVAWRQTAEFICKYFAKGRMIGIVGSIQTRNWEDKDGKRQYATEVVADEAYFTESKNQSLQPDTQLGADVNKDAATDFMPGEYEDDNIPF